MPQRKDINHLAQIQQRLPSLRGQSTRAVWKCWQVWTWSACRWDGRASNACQQHRGAETFSEVCSGKVTDKSSSVSVSVRTDLPHGDRLAVGQITRKDCAVSLSSCIVHRTLSNLSNYFEKEVAIEIWGPYQPELSYDVKTKQKWSWGGIYYIGGAKKWRKTKNLFLYRSFFCPPFMWLFLKAIKLSKNFLWLQKVLHQVTDIRVNLSRVVWSSEHLRYCCT